MSDSQKIISLEEGWDRNIKPVALDQLEAFLEGDMQPKKTKLFSNNEYSTVYTMCYNMCTQKSPYNYSEQLYQRHGDSIAEYLRNKVLPALRSKHDEFLLREFVKRGNNHTIMNKWYSKFFMYLDRFHVQYNQVPKLSDAGLMKYKMIIFDEVKKDVTAAILRMVNAERDGVIIDRDLIKECIKFYITMGMENFAQTYENDFENAFLDATREYYNAKAEEWIASESTPSYLIRVEQVLDDEKARVAAYLHASTETKLLQAIDKELLEKRQVVLLERESSGIKAMLINDQSSDLTRCFKLFSRITNGLEPIAEAVRQHVIDIGEEKIEQHRVRVESAASAPAEKEKGESKGDKEKEGPAAAAASSSDDPQFIRDLLSVHEKYLEMVKIQFSSHALFQKALKEAFVRLVNQDTSNGAGGGSGGSSSGSDKEKTAELIASFCDGLLKSGSTMRLTDEDIEPFLEKTVQLFSYLSDKDIFGEIYRNQLAKRLLNQRSASDDMERLMIGKLKLACGAQFTSKLEGMMNDLNIGAETSRNFEQFCKENPDLTGLGKVEFSVQVLTTGHWPQYKTFQEVKLPSIMLRCTEAFKSYYDSKTNYRKLTWTNSLGTAVIKGFFQKKSVEMTVATLQAIVMMLFNGDSLGGSTGGPIAFTQLQETTGMPEDVLKKVLHSLACQKFKVLKKTDPSAPATAPADGKAPGANVIKTTDVFSFNAQFTCPMNKVRIPMPSLEDSANNKRVEEDRSVAIEAAVVRIMKARKQLSHQQLSAEVLAQLAFFKPDPKTVKKRIESLIDREYLERDPENANTYRYLA